MHYHYQEFLDNLSFYVFSPTYSRLMSQKDYPPTKNGPSGCDYSGSDLNFIPADVMSSQKMTIVAI